MDKAAAGPETVVTAVTKVSRLTDKVVTEANTVPSEEVEALVVTVVDPKATSALVVTVVADMEA